MRLALFLCGTYALFAQSKIDTAFEKYWAVNSPAAAAKATDEIAQTGASFDEIFRRLQAGRTYAEQKPGVVILHNKTSNGKEHYFAVTVPDNYDPKRKYQVRFQLHGGVAGRENNKPRGKGDIGALAGAEQFYVIPYAWRVSPWWSDDQVLNLSTIVDTLKRTYNIDENRVVVAGVSDGATGTYYIAMRDTTPYASFLPLNGFLWVLSSDDIDDGRIFPDNLRNKPFYVINGGKDRLYPTKTVEPFTRHLMANGVQIDYHPQPDGEHNTRWWPEMKDSFEKFAADHPRQPHPAKLSWQASDLVHNRAHWLVIDQYGKTGSDAQHLPDLNTVSKTQGALFSRQKTSGRVDLVRTGNTIQASTRGVAAFTLLLSPDVFDFDQPVIVVANGKEVFNALVQKDEKTLLKWAAVDNDRTMLYAAEVKIDLK